ncbi:MAG: hypothetical protein LRY76_01120 [Alphaproteobacteria bacterium]|nr:hypothetical protein [Alphaproteobacteria bacterium]
MLHLTAKQAFLWGMTGNYAVLGIDVGGTKTRWALYQGQDKALNEAQIAGGSTPTQRRLKDHQQDIRDIIARAQKIAAQEGVSLTHIGIGWPAKFGADGVIMTGMAPNMGDPLGVEFDGVDIRTFFDDICPEEASITVLNDAVAQHVGITRNLLVDPLFQKKLGGQTIGYIAPGTGLGGSFLQIGQDLSVKVITDGHIQDMLVPLKGDGLALIEAYNVDHPDSAIPFYKEGHFIRSEDILSGMGLARLTGVDAQKLDSEAACRNHISVLLAMAQVMAAVIRGIRTGDFDKKYVDQNWSDEDKNLVKDTRIFILSGGVFQNNSLRQIIVEEAKKQLADEGINDIEFIPARDSFATYAAALSCLEAI